MHHIDIYIYIWWIYGKYLLYQYIHILSLQVRRSSLTRSLAKDQVLRGPFVYLGSIELSPFSLHVHRRQVFSTLVVIAPPCTPNFLWYQSHEWRPKTISVQYGSMLNLTWTPFETAAASFESNIFSITFRSQPLMGLSNLQWKATKTDIPELLQSKFVAVSLKKCYDFLRKFPN